MHFPLRDPQPDFQEFERVLKGERKPRRVHFAEIAVDGEVMEYISTNMMGKRLFYLEAERIRQKKINEFRDGKEVLLVTDKEEKVYVKRSVEFYYRMGYDYFPEGRPHHYLKSMIMSKVRTAKDTAALSRKGIYYSTSTKEGLREWLEE